MKNLIEKVSEQLARVGRVRPVNGNTSSNLTPDNFIMEMSHRDHQQIKG